MCSTAQCAIPCTLQYSTVCSAVQCLQIGSIQPSADLQQNLPDGPEGRGEGWGMKDCVVHRVGELGGVCVVG